MRSALALLLLAAVTANLAAASPDTAVANARIRLLPGDLPLAGYFDLTNQGAQSVHLVGAESPAFAHIHLHQSVQTDQVSRMAAVDDLAVAPGATVRFQPGGYHLMLMGRQRAMQVGDRVPITLQFAEGGSITVDFAVRGPQTQ